MSHANAIAGHKNDYGSSRHGTYRNCMCIRFAWLGVRVTIAMETSAVLEYLDCDDEAFLLHVRLFDVDLPSGATYELLLRARSGQIVARTKAVVARRVNATGEWRRSAFVFRISHRDLPSGGFRIELKN